jgi:methionyl aminopeptidase
LWCLQNGYHGDHAYSFEIGEVDPETKNYYKLPKNPCTWVFVSLRLEIVEDVGNAIQKYTESFGYGVVRELVGHGLGKKMHEDPEMPNYGKRGRGKLLLKVWL